MTDGDPRLDDSLDLGAAAEHLGVSPDTLLRLLDSGALAWHDGPGSRTAGTVSGTRHRLVLVRDLEAHRAERFALRQRLAGAARDRRYGVLDPAALTG